MALEMDFDSPDLVQKDNFLCCLCGDGKSMAFGTQEELQVLTLNIPAYLPT